MEPKELEPKIGFSLLKWQVFGDFFPILSFIQTVYAGNSEYAWV